ncbi:hypothetical protein RDABS01_035505 [Bienertia sinuspersici]
MATRATMTGVRSRERKEVGEGLKEEEGERGNRTEIRITKNLRTCYDCHSWFKIVSRMLTRVIIVRDRVRFYKFDGGVCSCGDY